MNSIMEKSIGQSDELTGKSVLVTGGTGSFGVAWARHVLATFKPKRLIVFSRDEVKQYEMAKVFPDARQSCMRYFIGDVRDLDRLEMAMRGVDIVIHAAALKQVPTAEYNPFECIRTNVHGAENVVSAAIRNGVRKVVALSTDKAANPINLYGASKLASDKIFIAANHLSAGSPLFSVVRYGNVLGSRGSVVPFFHALLAKGADHLPITDMRMTRFWITLRQGVRFVLSSLPIMQGGEIFVPKIPSMKVTDLARLIAPHLPLKEVGIRPGEKLHELLITEDDARSTLRLIDRFVIKPTIGTWWSEEHYQNLGAEPVEPDFKYTSDTNEQWLDDAGMLRLLEDCEA
jgi:UDP-N-acetylglucosamine 4,6-dehydratase